MQDTQKQKQEKEEKQEKKQVVLSSKNITVAEMKTIISKARAFNEGRGKVEDEKLKNAYLASLCPNPEDLIKLLAVYEELFPGDGEGIEDLKEALEKEYKKKAKFMGVFLFMIADSLKSIYKKAFKNYVRATNKENKLAQKEAERLAREESESLKDPLNPKRRGWGSRGGMTASEFSRKEAEYEHRIAELEKDALDRKNGRPVRGENGRPFKRGERGALFDDDGRPIRPLRSDDPCRPTRPFDRDDDPRRPTRPFDRDDDPRRPTRPFDRDDDSRRPHRDGFHDDKFVGDRRMPGKGVFLDDSGRPVPPPPPRKGLGDEHSERIRGYEAKLKNVTGVPVEAFTSADVIRKSERAFRNSAERAGEFPSNVTTVTERTATGDAVRVLTGEIPLQKDINGPKTLKKISTETQSVATGDSSRPTGSNDTVVQMVDVSTASNIPRRQTARLHSHAEHQVDNVERYSPVKIVATEQDHIHGSKTRTGEKSEDARVGSYSRRGHLQEIRDTAAENQAASQRRDADAVPVSSVDPAEVVFGIDFDNPVSSQETKVEPVVEKRTGIHVRVVGKATDEQSRLIEKYLRNDGYITGMPEKG